MEIHEGHDTEGVVETCSKRNSARYRVKERDKLREVSDLGTIKRETSVLRVRGNKIKSDVNKEIKSG